MLRDTRPEGPGLHRLALCALCTTLIGFSPKEAEADADHQVWAAWHLSTHAGPDGLGKKLLLGLDGHLRRGRSGQLDIVRPSLGYAIKPWLRARVGYDWVPMRPDGTAAETWEQRIWQQVDGGWHPETGPLFVDARLRFVQRWRSRGVGEDGDVGLRLRPWVRVQSRPLPETGVFLSFTDELLIGLGDTDWGQRQGIEQHWLFVGLGVQRGTVRVEAGWLHIDYPANDAATADNNAYLWVWTDF
jgi:hypothetical protein